MGLGAIAATVGSMLLSDALDYTVGLLTPPTVDKGERIEDFPGTTGHEGRAIPICYGQRTRVGGTVIYISPIYEILTEEQQSAAKKGDGADIINVYNYKCDLAVAVCEGQINDFTRIWANGRLIYRSPNAPVLSASGGMIASPEEYEGEAVMKIFTDEDLSDFITGVNVTVSGFTATYDHDSDPETPEVDSNNGTFMCLHIFQDAVGWTIILDNPHPKTESIDPGTITEQAWVLPPWVARTVTPYYGNGSDPVDPLLQAAHSNSPAYRHIAYIVFEQFDLKNWGHRIPNFTFDIKKSATPQTLPAVFEDLMTRAGLDEGLHFDLTQYDLSARTVEGINFQGTKKVESVVKQLLQVYALELITSTELLFVQEYKQSPIVDIDEDHLGCAYGDNPDELFPIEFEDISDEDLPHTVEISYEDVDSDFEKGSQVATRVTSTQGSRDNFSFALSMNAGFAIAWARWYLYWIWRHRRTFKLTLPPQYLRLREHDRIRFTHDGILHYGQIEKVDIGSNFEIRVEGLLEGSVDG